MSEFNESNLTQYKDRLRVGKIILVESVDGIRHRVKNIQFATKAKPETFVLCSDGDAVGTKFIKCFYECANIQEAQQKLIGK